MGENKGTFFTCFLLPHAMRTLRLLLPLLFLLFHRVAAITIPFRAFLTESIHLSKRSNLTGVPVQNGGNVIYGTTITLGGNNFSVVLDTGRYVHLYPPPSLVTHTSLVPTSGLLAVFPTPKTRESRSP